MKNIEQYKRRFNTLMESTMGDVKPLISEQGALSAIGSALNFSPEDEKNKKEFERFIESQSGPGMQGLKFNFIPISNKIARVNGDKGVGHYSVHLHKDEIPKDIKTNPCYSNLKLDEKGRMEQVDVKMSCKNEYQKLVYIMKKGVRKQIQAWDDYEATKENYISEQSPYAPGMGPTTTTTKYLAGVNPWNKSSLVSTDKSKEEATDEVNKKEFERFVDSQSVGHQGALWDFVPISNKVARVNNDPNADGVWPMIIPKESIPKDIKTNPCYSNLKLEDDGSIKQVDVKMSCKNEYRKLVYIAVKNPL